MTMTGEQLRAARALIRMEQRELASLAGISAESVRRYEAEDGIIKGRADTISFLKRALEAAGVVFITTPGIGVYKGRNAENRAFPKTRWIAAVSDRKTDLGYWDWVEQEKARESGE